MALTHIIKRDFSKEIFQLDKITQAILKAMDATGSGGFDDAQNIALSVYHVLLKSTKSVQGYTPTIEEVQDVVENKLMESEFSEAAKAYILYRNKRALDRKSNIFENRVNLKPFEYPQLYEYCLLYTSDAADE